MATQIQFYLDENVPLAVAEQLQRRGVTAVTVRDLGLLGDSDPNHLRRANREGWVFAPMTLILLTWRWLANFMQASSLDNSTGMVLVIGCVF